MTLARWSCAITLWLAACGRVGFAPSTREDMDDGGAVDATQAVAPSCAALPAMCGPAGDSSCCESLPVPGGTYLRGHDAATDGLHVDTTHPATVSRFRLDRYEINVGRFRAFLDAGGGTQLAPPAAGAGSHANIDGSGWDAAWNAALATDQATLRAALACDSAVGTWTDAPGPNERRPISCITWYEAMAFCAWDGGYLPTEAEWRYVAAGGDEQRAYPWSVPAGSLAIDEDHASYWVGGARQCGGDGIDGCAVTDFVPGGTKPAGDGRWGHGELAGNVWEWLFDFYDSAYPLPCVDCARSSGGPNRAGAGGGYAHIPTYLRTQVRNQGPPDTRSHTRGARCARP